MHFWKVIFQGEDISKSDDVVLDFRDILYRHENIEELQVPFEKFQELRQRAREVPYITLKNNIKKVWAPTGIEANKHNCAVICVQKNNEDEIKAYLFMLFQNKLTLVAAAPTLHAEAIYRNKLWTTEVHEIFSSGADFKWLEIITPWTEFWEVVLEGEDVGSEDDQIIEFYALESDDFPTLRFSFFYKLIKNALSRPNVTLIENIKRIRNPNGDEINLQDELFVILEGVLVEEQLHMAFLFRLKENQEMEVVGAYPDVVAEFCYEEKDFFTNTMMYFVEKTNEWSNQRIIINIETKNGDSNVTC